MRFVALVVVLCACGCIGFDAPTDSSAVTPDGRSTPRDDTMARACLTDPAYATTAGLTSRYREGVTALSWAAARDACAVEGAHLWVPDDAVEQNAWDGDWTGITDVDAEGVWQTVIGTPAIYLPWDAAQPDGGAGENCVRTSSSGFEDRECVDERDYVCECPPS